MGSAWIILIGIAFILWVASTTPAGRRLRRRLGVDRTGQAPRDDREYLLRVCDSDPARVERLLDLERRGRPDLTEAQAYRMAIRRHLRDRQ